MTRDPGDSWKVYKRHQWKIPFLANFFTGHSVWPSACADVRKRMRRRISQRNLFYYAHSLVNKVVETWRTLFASNDRCFYLYSSNLACLTFFFLHYNSSVWICDYRAPNGNYYSYFYFLLLLWVYNYFYSFWNFHHILLFSIGCLVDALANNCKSAW